MAIKHPALGACDYCGFDKYDREPDGITVTYYCALCGNFAAELIVGSEP